MKQSTNNGKPGGMLDGKRHTEGGMPAVVTNDGNRPVELETDEAILNAKSMGMDEKIVCEGTPKGVASAVNELGGGVSFANDGNCKVVKEEGGEISGSRQEAVSSVPPKPCGCKHERGGPIPKGQKEFVVFYINKENLKKRGKLRGKTKTWVCGTDRDDVISQISQEPDFGELVSAKPTGNVGELNQCATEEFYDNKQLASFVATNGKEEWMTRILLTDLCNKGVIPAGEYVIEVSW